jgi:hypothetical protein
VIHDARRKFAWVGKHSLTPVSGADEAVLLNAMKQPSDRKPLLMPSCETAGACEILIDEMLSMWL